MTADYSTRTRKIRIIFNPAARRGHTHAIAEQLHELARQAQGVDWVETTGRGHAVELACQAAAEDVDVVVAMGGDGTVHEIVNGLMKVDAARRPALGIVPIGSGNDLVVGAGLRRDPFEALKHILDNGDTRTLDVGRVRDNLGRLEYFVNVIGVGLDAAVTYRTQQIKFLRGFPMYFAALMQAMAQDFVAPSMQIECDEKPRLDVRVMMLAVANGTREGGGFIVTPKGDIGDGLLDYAMIGPVSRARMLQIIPDVMKGTHARHPEIRIERVRSLRLKAGQALAVHQDGEMVAWRGDGDGKQVTELEIGIVPGAIRLCT